MTHPTPQGTTLLPRAAVGGAPAAACPSAAATLLRLPSTAKRVVLLANTPELFPAAVLRAGDVAVHFNRARHAAAAMQVQGVEHWLVVRGAPGTPRRWFTPEDFTGYTRVIFVDAAVLLYPFAWYAAWRRRCPAKSPTTGFIIANAMQEVCRHRAEVLLAGFCPERAALWSGHNGQAEAAWYAERGFKRLPASGSVLVAVCTCNGYRGRAARFKDPAAAAEQRAACRSTWLAELPAGVCGYFFFGGAACRTLTEPDVVTLPAGDSYAELPAKTRAMFAYALSIPGWQWLFKCDDDSYIHLPRLIAYLHGAANALHGGPTRYGGPSGGAGYALPRTLVEALLADPRFPDDAAEDRAVYAAAARAGAACTIDRRFCHHAAPAPAPGNDAISCHHLTAAQMLLMGKPLT